MGTKVTDYTINPEVVEIMDKIIRACPNIFPDFDTNAIGTVHTRNKKSKSKCPITLKTVRYPFDVWIDKTYICEVADESWQKMNDKQKNLAVFHTMCSIPQGAFDEQSKNYGGKRRPDYVMYAEEFAVTGGVPNWDENPEARDVFELESKKDLNRCAVRLDRIAELDEDDDS